METNDLKLMPLAELWKLHEQVIVQLRIKLAAEKTKLEERLCRLQPQDHRMRRPYPKVFPKYQNPRNPTETWSGRGRQPRWLSPQLRSGKNSTISEFIIHPITLVGYTHKRTQRFSQRWFLSTELVSMQSRQRNAPSFTVEGYFPSIYWPRSLG